MAKLRFKSIGEDFEEFDLLLEDDDKSIEQLRDIALNLISKKQEEDLKEEWS
ncbi:MAG: hypothetical protein ACOC80_09160 [Petrotogales bacterium]